MASGVFLAWTGGVFWLGSRWGRDSEPRADPYGSVPFQPAARQLAEQARSASLQARYERLVVVPPRDGLGLNQWADLMFDQAATRTRLGLVETMTEPRKPAETMTDKAHSPDWTPDYSRTSKGFPAGKTEVE